MQRPDVEAIRKRDAGTYSAFESQRVCLSLPLGARDRHTLLDWCAELERQVRLMRESLEYIEARCGPGAEHAAQAALAEVDKEAT